MNFGGTTKENDNEAAGKFGEGFKLAAFVMLRNGYSVRYSTGGCHLSFTKQDDLFNCEVRSIAENENNRLKRLAAARPRRAVSSPLDDVSVVIGGVYRNKGKKITWTDWRSWMKVDLRFHQPDQIIETTHGGLILDPDFASRIYLKGFFINDKSASSKELKYGYDLYNGNTNRDRQCLLSALDEAKAITRIWESSFDNRLDVCGLYVNMLMDEDEDVADTNFAERYISLETARKIWLEVKSRHEPISDVFFHHEKDAAYETTIIQTSFKKKPVQLQKTLWRILKTHNIVQTADEYRHQILANAEPSIREDTAYALEFKRLIGMALNLHHRTASMSPTFRNSGGSGVDFLRQNHTILFNDRLLDFTETHEYSPCYLSNSNLQGREHYPCDHIIRNLARDILEDSEKDHSTGNMLSSQKNRTIFYSKLDEALAQMPREIQLEKGDDYGQLTVQWTDQASEWHYRRYGEELLECKVTLHRESTCASKKESTSLCSKSFPCLL